MRRSKTGALVLRACHTHSRDLSIARQDKLDIKLFKNNHLIGFIKLISIIYISPQEAQTTAPSGSVHWAANLKGYTE